MTANDSHQPDDFALLPPDDLADLADIIMNVGQEIKMLSAGENSIQLTITESNVMRFVDRHPGTSPSALAAGTGLQRSNMSAALRGLEEKGLIERAHRGEDGRTITVAPTELAAQNLAGLRKRWTSGIVSAVGSDADGLTESLDFLRRLEAGLIRSRQRRA
jgi:DNA-binding MarR family transcriptional regulator